jgi:hypothetical protein
VVVTFPGGRQGRVGFYVKLWCVGERELCEVSVWGWTENLGSWEAFFGKGGSSRMDCAVCGWKLAFAW